MDKDARACYDRINTSLSSAECRRWGLPYNVASFTNNFIEHQDFHIRTAYGISESHYTFDPSNPIQGSGQGVSWAGPRWTNTSNTICNIMSRTCTRIHFEDPMGEITVDKNADLFVDDTATGVTSSNIKMVVRHCTTSNMMSKNMLSSSMLQDIFSSYINVYFISLALNF